VSFPSTISNTASPLSERSVRCSSRVNKSDGFCAVQLEREPAKKRKINIIAIDAKIGKTRPVPLTVLQGRGINCGITPSEISNDALMQAPSRIVPHDDTNNEDSAI